jgi:mannose-1-phosphate guanylyltransferase/mannose-6-phosphate isomerase
MQPAELTGREAHLDRRPWGHFERFTLNEASTVKLISVAPGQRLSLQRHEHRDEWWTVLEGELTVTVDEESRVCHRGDRIWVRQGALHRAANRSGAPASFLEIAFGTFDEDDIERVEDDYSR